MYCGDYKDEETKFLTSVLHSRYKPVSGFRELTLLGGNVQVSPQLINKKLG